MDDDTLTVIGDQLWTTGQPRPFGLYRTDRRQHLYALGKTGTERLIPLNPRAVALVEDIQGERGSRRPAPAHLAHYLMVDAFGRHLTKQSYGRTLKDLTEHIHTT